MEYSEVFSKLTYETAVLVFFKKNGDIRVMLGTRNLSTVDIVYGFQGYVLGGHDSRCNINNGNLAVYDMVIGDARSFSIDRLVHAEFLGTITTKEEYEKALEVYKRIQEDYNKSGNTTLNMDNFNTINKEGVQIV